MTTPFTNNILCGDAAHILADMPGNTVDLVVTDPPYLCRYRDRTGRSVRNDNNPNAVAAVFDQVARVMKPHTYCISFNGWTGITHFAAIWERVGLRTVGHFMWPEAYASTVGFAAYRYESAFLLAKGRPRFPAKPISDVQPWTYTGNKDHPTQKAVEVIAPLIQSYSEPGALVLDPFLGSGTTAVAATLNNRHYCGIELDPRHASTAKRRLAALERPRLQDMEEMYV